MNLTDLFASQFDNAFRYQKVSSNLKIAGFVLNSALIFVSFFYQNVLENPYVVISVLIISILLLYFDYFYMEKSVREHEKGEKVRKIHLIDFMFNSKIEDVELEYLLLDVADWVKKRINKKIKDRKSPNAPNSTDSSLNFSNDETSQKSRIIGYIQQNCFETSQYLHLYYKELITTWKFVLIAGSIILLIICTILVLQGFSIFSSSQIVIGAFNLLFALNIIKFLQRYSEKANQLKTLDKTLQSIKKTAEFSDIIYYFSEYNSILVDKPLYPERVYEKNREEIEKRWKRENSKTEIGAKE